MLSRPHKTGTSQTRRERNKIVAFLAVLMMAAVPLASAIPEGSDAIFDNQGYYRYVIDYTDNVIDKVSVYIYAESGNPPADPQKEITTKNTRDSYWNFNSEGYGPFNSFYAAIDISSGVPKLILDPSSLDRTIDGKSYDMSKYNIVWMIPTVYWKSDDTHLYLTNDPGNDDEYQAYAHTIGGEVRKYIGIGVYEASTTTIDNEICLMSQTGKEPIVMQNVVTFDTWAHNTPGNTMLRNYYQWTFTKMATYMVGMGKNTQEIWGKGYTDTDKEPAITGSTDKKGPYGLADSTKGKNGSTYTVDGKLSSKVFIENSWGSNWEWVGDTVFDNRILYAGQNASGVDYTTHDGKNTGSPVSDFTGFSSNGWVVGTSKNAMSWDLILGTVGPDNHSDLSYPGDIAYGWGGSGNQIRILTVGGGYGGYNAGIAAMSYGSVSTQSVDDVGGRLAYYFDDLPISIVTFDMRGHGNQTPSQVLSNGDLVAEPVKPAEKNYIFKGWYSDKATTNAWDFSTPINEDLTLYALWDVQTHQPTGVTLTFESIGGGSVSPSKISVALGSVITVDGDRIKVVNGPSVEVIKAVPEEGYAVDSWSLPETIAVTDSTIKVTFKKVDVVGISVYTAPSKLAYSPGEYFDPTGLIVALQHDDGTEQPLQYRGNESLFSFTPSLDEPLKMSDKYVKITYKDVSVQQEISVKDASPGLDWTVVLLIGVVIAVIIAILALSFVKKRPDTFE